MLEGKNDFQFFVNFKVTKCSVIPIKLSHKKASKKSGVVI